MCITNVWVNPYGINRWTKARLGIIDEYLPATHVVMHFYKDICSSWVWIAQILEKWTSNRQTTKDKHQQRNNWIKCSTFPNTMTSTKYKLCLKFYEVLSALCLILLHYNVMDVKWKHFEYSNDCASDLTSLLLNH